MARSIKAGAIVLLALIVAGMAGWATLWLWLSPLPNELLRTALAAVFVLGTLIAFIFFKRRWRTLAVFVVVFAGMVAWYYAIPPSNDRIWDPSVAVLPSASINGDLVTIRNIRNFDYRTATDFTERYYDRTFDLNKLESVDFMSITWGMESIAHVIVSFGFGGEDFVAFSIEMRNQKGEESSMVMSFFRQYELIFIAADERDVIRLRTNFREPREIVELYRVRMPTENARKLFLSYVEKVDSLSKTPEWYNTLETNCTTGVLHRVESYNKKAHYNWMILLSGYTADYLYDIGAIDTSMPFAELKKISLINPKSEAITDLTNYSEEIRQGLPMPKPLTMEEWRAMK